MPLQRSALSWLVVLALVAATLYLLRDILLPFLIGLAIAYLLDPVADRLERLGLGRLGATLLLLGLFVVLLVLALIILVPLAVHQIAAFAERLPSYVGRLQALLDEHGRPLLERLGGAEAMPDIQRSLGNLVAQAARWLAALVQSLWSGGQAIIGLFGLLIVAPVVAFYLLIDWDRMVAAVDSWLPRRHRDDIRAIACDIDRAILGFLRGQSAVCLLLGAYYAIGLSLVGLNFAVLIGLTAGLLSFIPYVGSLTGLMLSTGIALVQFWPDWTMIGATLAVFITGQFIEGNILSPKLVGASVGLHPVWLMFALLAFGSLFGFLGLLIAVPLAAATGVLARFALARYLDSPLYRDRLLLPHPENDA